MQISMYSIYARRSGFSSDTEAFLHFRKLGVSYADILSEELSEISLSEYCKNLQNAKIAPDAFVSLENIASDEKSVRDSAVYSLRKSIDDMEKLGIRNLMLAPAVRYARSEAEFLRMRELLIRAFSETVEHVRGSGISVMIENQSIPTRADSRAEDIKIILDSVPGLGYVLDTGNFFCIREDVKAAYALLKGRVTRVHMKDWEIDKYGSFLRENLPRFDGVAIGDGLIPNKEMIEMLYADNYQGKIVLEVNSGRIDLPMLERSAKFLRENVSQ